MIIQKCPQGWRVTVPETPHNSEFSYDMPICSDGPEEIRAEQIRLARRLALLLFSMENFFKAWKRPEDFEKWEKHNKMNWNDWYHTRAEMSWKMPGPSGGSGGTGISKNTGGTPGKKRRGGGGLDRHRTRQ